MSWLEKLIYQIALSRSPEALVKASGGQPRSVRGFTLEPRLQYLENESRKRFAADGDIGLMNVRARTASLADLFGGGKVSGVRSERIYITGRSHSVPGRLYLPHVRDNSAAMLIYYHFGGGVTGSLENCDRLCALIAKAAGAPVFSVEYRLAPEHRFPAGLEDAMTAYQWGVENSARFGGAVRKAAVGGDSIGGTFAAWVAQQAAHGRMPKPVMQLLIYPWTDAASETPSMHDFADAFPLTQPLYEFFMRTYVAPEADLSDPRLSPLRAPDLSGVAPALIYTAGFDILLDQGEAYVGRLEEAGVRVRHARFDSLPHGFVSFPKAAPAVEAALKRIARETAEALKGLMA